MSATIPREDVVESENEPPLAADRADDGLREAAIASLKRKRKFAQDAIGYVAVSGVADLGAERRARGWRRAMARMGFADLGFPPRDPRLAGLRPLARLHRPITEDEIRRELSRGN